jgi:hypothetical protein
MPSRSNELLTTIILPSTFPSLLFLHVQLVQGGGLLHVQLVREEVFLLRHQKEKKKKPVFFQQSDGPPLSREEGAATCNVQRGVVIVTREIEILDGRRQYNKLWNQRGGTRTRVSATMGFQVKTEGRVGSGRQNNDPVSRGSVEDAESAGLVGPSQAHRSALVF